MKLEDQINNLSTEEIFKVMSLCLLRLRSNVDQKEKINDKTQKILNLEISKEIFTARVANALNSENIFFIKELLNYSLSDLYKNPNLGVKSCAEILFFLNCFELQLLKKGNENFYEYKKIKKIVANWMQSKEHWTYESVTQIRQELLELKQSGEQNNS